MKHYIKRRQNLSTQMVPNSALVVFSGHMIKKSADAAYPFEVNRNFYYLTGIDEPEAVLVLIKQHNQVKQIIFIRDINPLMEKWNGKYITKEEASEVSGVEQVQFVSRFDSFMQRYFTRTSLTMIYVDSERISEQDIVSVGERYADNIRNKWMLQVSNAYPMITSLRAIKDEIEIEKIKEAIAITNEAFLKMLKSAKSGQHEYELQAEFEYVLKKNNAKPSFDMIVAASKRACVLHYITNDHIIEKNSLILTDMGACKDYYCADITRTFPSDGIYSPQQKELMIVVLETMDLVIKAAQPHVTLAQLNQIVISHYQKRLLELGYIKNINEVSDVYYHGVSHFLGLDTHDVGQIDGMPLQAGHVITVEPGLYIESLKIGIRIEDNILITENGCINLSKDIIKTPEEIESTMSQI